jgi:hypothetical protein
MEQGKGSMVYYPGVTLATTQKAGHRKILEKPSRLIDHRPEILANELGTIGSAAYWTAIAKFETKLKYIKNIDANFTLGLDFFVILA